MELGTGRVLYGLEENRELPMASTTKILTALLTLEQPDLDQVFPVDPQAVQVEGSSMGLKTDSEVTLRLLAQGMLLCSGNDAANAAAVRIGGSLPGFAQLMNQRASQIGMEHSHFVTPSGLDAERHYSTAYDMALLAREALQNPDFLEICSSPSLRVIYPGEDFSRTLENHNRLLADYQGCIGVKTGFTKKAGRCLVSAAIRDGAGLICVTLGAPNDWQDHAALLDYGFSQMASHPVKDSLEDVQIPVVNGDQETTGVQVKEPLSYFSSAPLNTLERKTQLLPFLYAPVQKGERVGTVGYYQNGALLCQGELLAAEDVALVPPREKGLWETLWVWLRQRLK